MLNLGISDSAQMMIGGALLVLVLFGKPLLSALNPAFVDKSKSTLSKLNPFSWFGNGTSKDVSSNDIHGLVAKIMDYFTTGGDSRGLSLAVAVGQHVYQRQQEELENKIKTAQAAVASIKVPTNTSREVVEVTTHPDGSQTIVPIVDPSPSQKNS